MKFCQAPATRDRLEPKSNSSNGLGMTSTQLLIQSYGRKYMYCLSFTLALKTGCKRDAVPTVPIDRSPPLTWLLVTMLDTIIIHIISSK